MSHERFRLDGMHLHRRLLAALVILLGGMYEFWRTGRVTGLELLLGPDSGGIKLSGRYQYARRQSRTPQLVRSAIDENGDLEHEA
jgi:hypothetical protein